MQRNGGVFLGLTQDIETTLKLIIKWAMLADRLFVRPRRYVMFGGDGRIVRFARSWVVSITGGLLLVGELRLVDLSLSTFTVVYHSKRPSCGHKRPCIILN